VPEQRHDLGESLARLLRAVIALEEPVLAAHGLVMWDYVVLSALGESDAPAQAVLAGFVGRDKTRLIPILDRLEARGLLRRDVDPADRRNRVVRLTDEGRDLLGTCRRGIRAAESDLLADLATEEHEVFLDVVDRLADRYRRSPG
jgi:DNA-binding MarR family transcriptional regulator